MAKQPRVSQKGHNAKDTTRRQFIVRTAALIATGAGITHAKPLAAISRLSNKKAEQAKTDRTQALDKRGLRIVTTTPSGTELIEALGQSNTLVGVDNYSTYPQKVTTLPKVGDVVNPDIHAIAELKPDLVILDEEQSSASQALEKHGIKTISITMKSTRDVQRALSKLGKVLGQEEQANKVNEGIESTLNQQSSKNAGKKVLVILDRIPENPREVVAAGPGSQLDDLLRSSGLENVFSDSNKQYPNVTLEDAVKKGTELILDLSEGGRANVSDWQKNPHFQDIDVTALSAALLLSPTPRVKEAVASLKKLAD